MTVGVYGWSEIGCNVCMRYRGGGRKERGGEGVWVREGEEGGAWACRWGCIYER